MATVTKLKFVWSYDNDFDALFAGKYTSNPTCRFYIDRRDGKLVDIERTTANDDDFHAEAMAATLAEGEEPEPQIKPIASDLRSRGGSREHPFYVSENYSDNLGGYEVSAEIFNTTDFKKHGITPEVSDKYPMSYWMKNISKK